MMMLAVGIDMLVQNLGLFNIPDTYTVVIGLVLAQVSKALHNQYEANGSI
jgi:hypothetical protein